MSGTTLRWERMTDGTEFAYSGTVCVGGAGTRGMCVWRCEVSGTGGTARSPAEARAEVEAAWAGWCARAGLGPVTAWRPIETAPRKGDLVLVAGGTCWGTTLAQCSNGQWREPAPEECDCRWASHLVYPTHWQPLPEPPAAEVVS